MEQNTEPKEINSQSPQQNPPAGDKRVNLNSKKKLFLNKGFIAVFILLLLVLTAAIYNNFKKSQIKQPMVIKKTIMVQKLMRRSKKQGLILRGLTGKGVDLNTGKIVTAARIFTSTDNTVFLELDLNSAQSGTAIDYIRYKERHYVDHGELILAKANIQNILFQWTINKLLAGVRDGNWTIATYSNGILEQRISYQVKSDKIGNVHVDNAISRNDQNYNLKNTLSSLIK